LSDTVGQTLRLDNIGLYETPQLLVPEPETYAVLGIALFFMMIVFRKQLRRQWDALVPAGSGMAT
jgi:hypothetical protein